MLASELWENKCDFTLNRVSYILDVWELRKVRLYGGNPSIEQSQSEIAPGEVQGVAGGGGELCLVRVPHNVCSSIYCTFFWGMFVYCGSLCSSSAHSSGCVVNGSSAMAAS